MSLKILFIGDIVGKIARKAVTKALPDIKKEFKPDLIIANGENSSHGFGITRSTYEEIKNAGVDVVTLGDHAFDKKEAFELLDQEKEHLIRPANFAPNLPGAGFTTIEIGSKKILIINLVGRVFMKKDFEDPFKKIDEILAQFENEKLAAIFIDFQAEATSEKIAFGWHVDGRVSALVGTHTHVPTADAKILPQSTAYVSDVGMVGARDSVIGFVKDEIVKSFQNQISGIKEPEENGACQFNSVLIDIDTKTGKATKITRLDKEIEF